VDTHFVERALSRALKYGALFNDKNVPARIAKGGLAISIQLLAIDSNAEEVGRTGQTHIDMAALERDRSR